MDRKKSMGWGRAGLPITMICIAALVGITGIANAQAHSITFVQETDPPGLNAPPLPVMDGGITEINEGDANSFWVRTSINEGDAIFQAYVVTTPLYNLESVGGGGPDYADGGDPRCLPRVIVTNASLRKGNNQWPLENREDHYDWYQLHSPTGPVTISVTRKAIDIPVTYAGDTGLEGPAVVHHEVTGHSITIDEVPGYNVTDASASSGVLDDNGDDTWTLSGVTDYEGVTITVTAEMENPVEVPSIVFEEPLTPEEAQTILMDAGLSTTIVYGYSNTVPEGYVIGQSIQAGTVVPGDVTTVSIIVSQGPPPPMPLGWMPVLIVLMLIALAVVGGQALRRRTQH